MVDGEQLVAERDVMVSDGSTPGDATASLRVQIWQNPAEEFWKVQVCIPSAQSQGVSTTVVDDDSPLRRLIQSAVEDETSAWEHLAMWGRTNLSRPARGFRFLSV
jgi:hypothetical protein